MKAESFCEISCNRFDGYISVKSKSNAGESRKSVINSLKFLTDEAELTAVTHWLRSISNIANEIDITKPEHLQSEVSQLHLAANYL